MGGSGSGNRYRFDSKTIAEHCCSIDVRQLSRWGYLKPWLRYPLKWNNESNIVIETKPGAIELFYGISRNEQPREDVHIEVPLCVVLKLFLTGSNFIFFELFIISQPK